MNRIATLSLSLSLALGACASKPAAPAASPPAPSPAPAALPAEAAAVVAPAASRQPAAPYWSLQIASTAGKSKALATLDTLKDDAYARAEKRKSGWQVRVGAWPLKAEAEAALPEYQQRYGKSLRALQLENPVDWLLPGGEMLPVASAEAAPAAPEAPVAKGTPDAGLRDAAARLDGALRAALKTGVAHADRYVYAADAVPLLRYAAARRDSALYEKILPAAMLLVWNSKDDPYAQGFVATRMKDGGKPESSDATAMADLSGVLLDGAEAFKRPDDRAAAQLILDGYARHAYEMQGTWLVRHAFDFGARNFSSGSLVTDYDADLLARADGGATKGFAAKSQALLAGAAGATGLLRPLIQPEIGATWPNAGIGGSVAPNNLTPLADACQAAVGTVASNPEPARGLLAFAVRQPGALRAFYNVETGAPGGDAPLPPAGLACLVTLASRLDDGRAVAALDSRFTAALRAAKGADLGTSAALLSAAQARGAF